MRTILIISFLTLAQFAFASGIGEVQSQRSFEDDLRITVMQDEGGGENVRLVGMLVTVAVGPFGGHRIYYGTSAKVPIFYALTLGGGLGILPLIDLLVVAFSKDLTPYMNNDSIFMWLK